MTATLILLLQLPSTETKRGVGVGGEKIPLYAGRVLLRSRKMTYR